MTPKTAKPLVGRHIVRYGIVPDQKYLIGDLLKTYDQLVLLTFAFLKERAYYKLQ